MRALSGGIVLVGANKHDVYAFATTSPITTTLPTTTSTTPTTSTGSTTSSGGGSGIPEFSAQFGFVLLVTVVVVMSRMSPIS